MATAVLFEDSAFSIDDFLAEERSKDLLRFSTAGSVDDGKSTLIGRLLYDTQSVYEDQVRSIEGKGTTAPGQIDFALLTDGLRAEREQGITIDVAYRYFSTARRKFIIADTPGTRTVHAQHGDRRLNCRCRGRAHRRTQGSARPVAAPRVHRLFARRSAHPRRRQQNGPGRAMTNTPFARSNVTFMTC